MSPAWDSRAVFASDDVFLEDGNLIRYCRDYEHYNSIMNEIVPECVTRQLTDEPCLGIWPFMEKTLTPLLSPQTY